MPLVKNIFNIGKSAAKSSAGKRVIKAAKRTAMDAGLDVLHDVLEGQNLKAVAKKNAKKMGSSFVSNLKRGGKTKAVCGKRGKRGKGRKTRCKAKGVKKIKRRGKKGKKSVLSMWA